MIYLKITLVLLLMLPIRVLKAASLTDSAIVLNAGINGNSTRDMLLRVDKDVIAAQPQLVVIMVGTNDLFNPKKLVNLNEYERNYQLLISKISKHSEIILMTIPPVIDRYIIQRKPELRFSGNEPNASVDSINMVIKRLAEKYRCSLIDLNRILRNCGGADDNEESLFQNETNFGIPDGVHLTYAGCCVTAAVVYEAIQMRMPDAKKIVCFGDSITRGYRLKGEGTTEGEVYPALLKNMLNNN